MSQFNMYHRCRATTTKGTECTRDALSGSEYCWQHQNYESKNPNQIDLDIFLQNNNVSGVQLYTHVETPS